MKGIRQKYTAIKEIVKQWWIGMRMPKLVVEIILANQQRIIKKCSIDHDRVVINKGKKGFGGKEWAPTFSEGCLINYRTGIWPFKGFKQKVVVKHDAEECIDFSKKAVDVPSWDKHAAEKYHEAQVLKHAGAVDLKASVPIVFYLGLAVSFITLFIVLMGGRIRF